MICENTPIEGIKVLSPKKFEDSRGYFFESYNKESLKKIGIYDDFIQDNQSLSSYGTVRGLHLQTGDFAQSKLIRVISGTVIDTALDLRIGSPSFGKYFQIELSAENNKQLYIPRGFAHGFSVTSKSAIFAYKCDNIYNKESEAGILCTDNQLSIEWNIPENEMIISEKDLLLPSLEQYKESL
jgi:dTDP-4-dehydrorhamnose 3,5-epimerase